MSHPALSACLQRLGLERLPFPPVPDAGGYFHTPALERELEEMAHFLRAGSGIVLLTGEVGTGKTTFLRRLLGVLDDGALATSLVFNTFLQGPELLSAILRDFGLRPAGRMSRDIELLNAFLLESHRAGRRCVLAIDDAQNLDGGSLELVRLLTGLETGQEKLLQIVLSGQPELCDTLAGGALRQLASRIAKHVRMAPFDRAQLADYVAFRLADAGAGGRIALEPAGLAALHRATGGNQRRVHAIMDRCLYGLVARGATRVGAPLVEAAAAEAGMLVAPRRAWPRLPTMAFASVGAAGAALAGLALALALQSASNDVSASAPSPAAVAQAPAAAAAAAGAGWQRCLAALATGTEATPARTAVHLAHVDAGRALRLRTRTDACVGRDARGWVAAWNASADPAQFFSGPAAYGHVRRLQARLAGTAYDTGEADGFYGPRTREAVARFQRDNGLPDTGVVDAITLLYIETAPAALAAAAPATQRGNANDG